MSCHYSNTKLATDLKTIRRYKYKGFTLIELLVVIVIFGIVSTVTLFAFGDFGASRKAKVTAEQFGAYIKLLQQRAILEISTFGIHIVPTGYETFYLDPDSTWKPMPPNSFFHGQAIPKKVIIFLQSPNQRSNRAPDIIINPSGNMTPFQLFFGTQEHPQLINLLGKHSGEIIIQDLP